ncbi:unnamed protein product [Soboliphyme baturini]|uniref:MARVEL domain-containing protein n=1 Tax=Soboliphyme baturini TaxID=241478 RepID=A0A183J914_9BILA|nr:unnamed protein product [Soboliphyme baturini]
MSLSRICPLCGPKCSICCMVISAWGVVFMAVLGIAFYTQTALLYQDLHIQATVADFNLADVAERYRSSAFNCWIAAGGYVLTLIIAFWQNRWSNTVAL